MGKVPSPVPVTENIVAYSIVAENSSNQDGEVEGPSIYLRNLPVNSGPLAVEEAFMEFGVIKHGGVQARNNKKLAQNAIELYNSKDSVSEIRPILLTFDLCQDMTFDVTTFVLKKKQQETGN
ncbi:hypothetical protein V2J09_021979 [Rumex salicifolius]